MRRDNLCAGSISSLHCVNHCINPLTGVTFTLKLLIQCEESNSLYHFLTLSLFSLLSLFCYCSVSLLFLFCHCSVSLLFLIKSFPSNLIQMNQFFDSNKVFHSLHSVSFRSHEFLPRTSLRIEVAEVKRIERKRKERKRERERKKREKEGREKDITRIVNYKSRKSWIDEIFVQDHLVDFCSSLSPLSLSPFSLSLSILTSIFSLIPFTLRFLVVC